MKFKRKISPDLKPNPNFITKKRLREDEIDFDKLTFPVQAEDMLICHYLYKEMIKKGINFVFDKY